MPLTDARIRAEKPGKSVVKLSDGGGLQLWISPAGGKVWKLAYRFDGKQKKLTLGEHSVAYGLAEARADRAKYRRVLAAGDDPGQQKRLERLEKANNSANTFAIIAAELIDKKRRENRAPATLAKTDWLIGFAHEDLASRPIAEIKAAEVLVVLRKVEKRGRLETARRLRSVIGEVFRYAIATARATDDPTFALRGALTTPTVKHRAAITTEQGLGALMRAIAAFQGQPTTIAALRMMALCFPRPGELRLAEWGEFDLEAALWTIPGSRTKMRREHHVPLSRQAIRVMRELHGITGRGKLAFPGYGVGSRAGKPVEQRPISENTMNAALRRMGYGPDEMTAHGFRAAASTLLNESGQFSSDAIERALAHQEEDDVRRAYARGQFWKERVAMAQWWADQLEAWQEGGKVIPLRA